VEVGTLSSQVTFKPVSCSLQTSIRFLHSPKPTYLSASLTLCFPCLNGDIWGFHVPLIEQKYGLGSIYTPVVFFVCVSEAFILISYHTPFGSSLSASLACYDFTMLTIVRFYYPYRTP